MVASLFSNAAMDVCAVAPHDVNPCGDCTTLSPWLIHTLNSSGSDEKILLEVIALKCVRPYSRCPV